MHSISYIILAGRPLLEHRVFHWSISLFCPIWTVFKTPTKVGNSLRNKRAKFQYCAIRSIEIFWLYKMQNFRISRILFSYNNSGTLDPSLWDFVLWFCANSHISWTQLLFWDVFCYLSMISNNFKPICCRIESILNQLESNIFLFGNTITLGIILKHKSENFFMCLHWTERIIALFLAKIVLQHIFKYIGTLGRSQ